MTTVNLTFTAPTRPLSINEGGHWAAKRKRLEPWKDAAWTTARSHLIRARKAQQSRRVVPAQPVPIAVQVVIPFRTNVRRDPHNYTGTVVKAIVDGLVRADLVPDDTADWVTVLDPELVVIRDKSEPLTATIRIRPRETP